MAIARYTPDAPSPVVPNLPKIEPPSYRGIVEDDRQMPLIALLSQIEGAPWTVQYYSQIVSKHNDIRELDVTQPTIYQQYSKIQQLELKVTSPLTESHDTDAAVTSITGTAMVYPFLLPNAGDHFVANAGLQRSGVFRVKDVDRKSFNREAVFSIDYDLIGFTDEPNGLLEGLETRVITTYYFHKDRVLKGLSPTLIAEDHQHVIDLKGHYDRLGHWWIETFFDRSVMTLTLPGQAEKIYDPYLVDYVLKTLPTTIAPSFCSIRAWNVENDPAYRLQTLWTALLTGERRHVQYGQQHMALIDTVQFQRRVLPSIRYSSIRYLVYPYQPDTTVETGMSSYKEAAEQFLIDSRSPAAHLEDLIVDPTLDARIRTIAPVATDNYYLLSEAFYTRQPVQTRLEDLVSDYLAQRALSIQDLLLVIGSIDQWGRVEQFYYTPMVLTLIQVALKGRHR